MKNKKTICIAYLLKLKLCKLNLLILIVKLFKIRQNPKQFINTIHSRLKVINTRQLSMFRLKKQAFRIYQILHLIIPFGISVNTNYNYLTSNLSTKQIMGCESSKLQKDKHHKHKHAESNFSSQNTKFTNKCSMLTNPSEGSNEEKKLLNQQLQKQKQSISKLQMQNQKLKKRLSLKQLVFNNSKKLLSMAPNKRICALCFAQNDVNKMSTAQRQKIYDICEVCDGQGLLKKHQFITVDRCGICGLYFQYLWVIQQCPQCKGVGTKSKLLEIQSDLVNSK